MVWGTEQRMLSSLVVHHWVDEAVEWLVGCGRGSRQICSNHELMVVMAGCGWASSCLVMNAVKELGVGDQYRL